MTKERRQFTLDADVESILSEIGEGPSSASAYLEALVRDAEREWRGALVTLRHAGWSDAALCAGCDVLNGWALLDQPPTWAAQEMRDGQRLNQVCAKWGVDPLAWATLTERVGDEERVARALTILAREFWRENPRAHRAMGLG